jgi:hypothetical protein
MGAVMVLQHDTTNTHNLAALRPGLEFCIRVMLLGKRNHLLGEQFD